MTDENRLVEYRRGWVDGAGFRGHHGELRSSAGMSDYERGYRAGKAAFRDVIEAERKRLKLPESAVIRALEAR